MKRNIKKNQQAFYDAMLRFFLYQSGAKQKEGKENSDLFEIKTLGGLLTVTLPKPGQHEYCYTVFSRFDHPNRAAQICTCSKPSGKYNYHGTGTPEQAIEQAKMHFECVYVKTESKELAKKLAGMVCNNINTKSFVETYGRQACLEEVISILERRV